MRVFFLFISVYLLFFFLHWLREVCQHAPANVQLHRRSQNRHVILKFSANPFISAQSVSTGKWALPHWGVVFQGFPIHHCYLQSLNQRPNRPPPHAIITISYTDAHRSTHTTFVHMRTHGCSTIALLMRWHKYPLQHLDGRLVKIVHSNCSIIHQIFQWEGVMATLDAWATLFHSRH